MTKLAQGRITPAPPLPSQGSGDLPVAATYWWNTRHIPAIGAPDYLIREKQREAEAQIAALVDAQNLLSKQPKIVQRGIRYHLNKLEQTQGIQRANTHLTKNFVERVLPRLNMVNDQYLISTKANDTAPFACRFNQLPDYGRADIETLAKDIALLVKRELGIVDDDVNGKPDLKIALALYVRASALTRAFRQSVPGWDTYQLERQRLTADKIASFIAKMQSESWWTRCLRRHSDKWKEHLHIALGNVSKKASPYSSLGTVSDWREQKRRTREFLKSMELEDEKGNRISLIDKYDHSVANPAIRRCELMARIRGFEDICNEMGYVGEFYTLTAPSKYHATNKHGHRNRKWCGADPARTQRYLRGVWSRVRAKLHREDIRVFGIRVAEPHHDGTPHWHMLLFMLPESVDQARKILCDYASEEDEEELYSARARKARFHAEAIDPEKGSATGYIAKYISKNIDGYALDGETDDETDKPLKEVAPAVSAWASRWRIRQFQFIGGAPVTVYRELRKMSDHETAMGLSVEFAAVHDAADYGRWAEYVNAQGGPFVKRENLIARTYYETSETTNEYFEDVIRIRGVFSPPVGIDTPIITRTTEWKIVKARALDLSVDLAVDIKGAPAPSRSSVNNCTGVQKIVSPPVVIEPPPPPENICFDALTAKERRQMLKRIRSEPVKPRQKPKKPRPPTQGEIMLAAKPSEKEQKIKEFAASIGIDLNDNILKSMAKGASVLVGDITYRAGTDGALYQVHRTATPVEDIKARFERLRQQQVPKIIRLVGEHYRREQAAEMENDKDKPVWFGPFAG
ncbi:TPA: replication endonuclease [Yersinia enterocolitica]|nr:replication endonuclease [Yersinia enterocolitica]HDL8226107.1 replication endonuclease [Yersinia enterocolitica]HDM8344502.1 replication endonuclease [Yersinia enterocolitica]HDQ4037035.1 replication endonuclease [Yersinia enterocolitica]HEN3598432.1 replication endonuclease [Yersinia enterocolitica]